MSDEIEEAAQRMAEYLSDVEGHDIDNTGDMESIYLYYGAGGPGSIEINLHELARAALEKRRDKDYIDAGDILIDGVRKLTGLDGEASIPWALRALEVLEKRRDHTPAESDYESMNQAWFSKDRTELDDRYIVGFAEGIQVGRQQRPIEQRRVPDALDTLSNAMRDDPDLAWSWHCMLAMMAQDAGAPHREANERASGFMWSTFGVSTPTDPNGGSDAS